MGNVSRIKNYSSRNLPVWCFNKFFRFVSARVGSVSWRHAFEISEATCLIDRHAHLGTRITVVGGEKRDAPSFLEQTQKVVVTMDDGKRPETLPVSTCMKIIELFSSNNWNFSRIRPSKVRTVVANGVRLVETF